MNPVWRLGIMTSFKDSLAVDDAQMSEIRMLVHLGKVCLYELTVSVMLAKAVVSGEPSSLNILNSCSISESGGGRGQLVSQGGGNHPAIS